MVPTLPAPAPDGGSSSGGASDGMSRPSPNGQTNSADVSSAPAPASSASTQASSLPAWAQAAALPVDGLLLAQVMLPGSEDVLAMAALHGYDVVTTGAPHAKLTYEIVVTTLQVSLLADKRHVKGCDICKFATVHVSYHCDSSVTHR